MSRLILVSNRLPITVSESARGLSLSASSGGLATALSRAHSQTGSLWIGWPGAPEPTDRLKAEELERRLSGHSLAAVHLSERQVHQFYGLYSNSALWPLFHYLTGTVPLIIEGWEEYREVNSRFAEEVVSRYREGDTIWVHDYQLMLLPALLREALPQAPIGFFLHVPFPAAELFATLPQREALLTGVLGADLVGFQTSAYRQHFREAVDRILGRPGSEETVLQGGREVRLGVFPIGIDFHSHAGRARTPEVEMKVQRLRGDGSSKILVAIDRLDYTKGIPRRLLAFEELLTRRPRWRGRVKLIQVAVPSRSDVQTYRSFRREVESLIGRINGAFGTTQWQPIHYMHNSLEPDELSALYRAADVMLVTPIRDGMNLVAKEFAASRIDGDAVLVLSEFAGAAAELGDALIVNPFDVAGSADAYHRALTMPTGERQQRMAALRRVVAGSTVDGWTSSFLQALQGAAAAREEVELWAATTVG